MTLERTTIAFEKIKSIDVLSQIVARKKVEGNKVGLITGGFDIVHQGHLSLFRFAKRHVDILLVGVEQDKTISISKGSTRPINTLNDRCDFLAELSSIDYVFAVPFTFQYGNNDEADKMFAEVYKELNPDFLITNINGDRFWEQKMKRAQVMKIGFLGQDTPKDISSSSIASIIRDEL